MILLGFESTAQAASVALWRDGKTLAQKTCTEQKRHSETLLPLADSILSEAGLTLADVDDLAVDVGPGSFTGVRIGTASVNAIAQALGKNVIGVDALTVIWTGAGRPDNALIVLDALGGRAYAARFENGICAMPPKMGQMEEFLAAKPEDARLILDATPDAAALCEAAAKRIASAAEAAYPLYLAPSQAERLFTERQKEKKV